MAKRNEPSKGGKPDKMMRDAIMVALKREAVDSEGQPTKKLNNIAAKLVELAEQGDMQAIKEINDRVDGKSPQALTGGDGGPLTVAFKTIYESKNGS